MYLTIRQHDLFRTLLMGFEIPFRRYVAHIVTSKYISADNFERAMMGKKALLSPASPQFLRDILPKACSKQSLKLMYRKFEAAIASTDEIISEDIDIPMVGALNLVTFAIIFSKL